MLKKSTLNILRNKARGILTMAGIAVGVFAVALISQISATGEAQVSEILDSMGINTVLVQSRLANVPARLGDEDLNMLNSIGGIEKAMPLMSANSKAVVLHQSLPCLTWGVNGEAHRIISLVALHGRLINERDIAGNALVCVIDESIARKTYGRSNIVGKRIELLVGGVYREFEVIGVASSGLSVLQSALSGIIPDFVYIPFSTMQNLTGRSSFDKIAVLLGDDPGDNISGRIEQRLSGNDADADLIASNLQQQKNQLHDIMGIVTLALSVIAGISLLVAGLTVMTTMLVSVSERKREIGIKKSVGARNFDIMREFLLESSLLALLGGLAGALIALAVSLAGSAILGIGFIFSPMRFLSPVLFALLLGALFGGYPALLAARMKPIEALRS